MQKGCFPMRYKEKNGFTLIELIVTLAILTIVMSVVVSMFSFITSTNQSTKDNFNAQSTAENIIGMIKAELQYSSSVSLRNNYDPGVGLDGENYIYLKNNIIYQKIGKSPEKSISPTSLNDISCVLSLTISGPMTIDISINIMKNNVTLYSLKTSIYMNNLTVAVTTSAQSGTTASGILQGNAIVYSKIIKSIISVSSISVTSNSDVITQDTGTLQMSANILPTDAANKMVF